MPLPVPPVQTTGARQSKPDFSGSILGKRLAFGPAVFVSGLHCQEQTIV